MDCLQHIRLPGTISSIDQVHLRSKIQPSNQRALEKIITERSLCTWLEFLLRFSFLVSCLFLFAKLTTNPKPETRNNQIITYRILFDSHNIPLGSEQPKYRSRLVRTRSKPKPLTPYPMSESALFKEIQSLGNRAKKPGISSI